MSVYKKAPIGNYVVLQQGFAINKKTKHLIVESRTPLKLLRIADMKEGQAEVFVSEDIPEKFIAQKNDIIYTRTGQVGLVFTGQYGVVHNNCFTVTPIDSSINRAFLYYALQDPRFYESANRLSSGAAQPDLPHPAFNSIEISIPNVREQKAIAAVLSAYDELIENNRKQIKLLEEAAQRLYKEWFVDLRFPEHETTLIDPATNLPEGWRRGTVGDLLKKLESGSRPSGGIDKTLQNGIPSVGAENVLGLGRYNYDSEKLISKEYFRTMKRGIIADRDILVYKDGAYTGRVSLFQDGFPCDMAAVNEHVFLAHCDDEAYQYWLFFTLNQPSYFATIQNLSASSAQPGINQNDFSGLSVVVPTQDISKAFSETIEPLLTQLFLLAKQNRSLQEARDRLLPKLMSGEIEVS